MREITVMILLQHLSKAVLSNWGICGWNKFESVSSVSLFIKNEENMQRITVMFFLLHWNEAKVVVFGRLIEFSMSSYL